MTKVPDAWEDEWSSGADPTTPANESAESKKASSKVTKAQRRAQQAEFNRQLWAEAEGPKETNYFLESRNVPPLRSEFKPPPILLSRKGPIIQSSSRPPPTSGLSDLSLNDKAAAESSEDEDEVKARELSLAERQAQAAKDREEKQRKYEERRLELFGPSSGVAASNNTSSHVNINNNKSGNSSPSSLTPPGSRSATPNQRGRGKGGGRRGGGGGGSAIINSRNQSRGSQQQRDLYDPSYVQRPDSGYIQRRENASGTSGTRTPEIQPIRAPRGPDGSGRGGFGFAQTHPFRGNDAFVQ
ncbi:uncharacterized protein PV06_10074 [Exophiala oligosperma]|uniref:SUZ-C domain-containing protein n=2 Tax=Chaetothyriales TaxID=34395 RepID=A0A0D2D4F7_9EURO|nr:uncharacterized protein PV06_10074 [Exophiala oligosperma]KAJ9636569.1 hypothetical protein H2204_005169 [Knufia peltigerae]KIW38113.1 hypothetical protein PV06_10074 [Exophiala oligosperma]